MTRDVSGLKHPGVRPGWAWLRDGSKPEADQVITGIEYVQEMHMLQSAFCPLEWVRQMIWHRLYMVQLRYINPPSQPLSPGISSAFGAYGPRQGDISTPLHSGVVHTVGVQGAGE